MKKLIYLRRISFSHPERKLPGAFLRIAEGLKLLFPIHLSVLFDLFPALNNFYLSFLYRTNKGKNQS